eukprot:9855425-Lingulodinium_polyedra.AAC.1
MASQREAAIWRMGGGAMARPLVARMALKQSDSMATGQAGRCAQSQRNAQQMATVSGWARQRRPRMC